MFNFRSSSRRGKAPPQEGLSLLNLEPNLKGTDYFVGDLHGEGRLLYAALQELNFDWERDRLIAVGDLVNRGGSHFELFQIVMNQPNFHSVLGDHDVNCWAEIQRQLGNAARPKFGESAWLNDFDSRAVVDIRNFIQSLPLAIHVPLSNGLRVGVVHADFPSEMTSFFELADISRKDLPTIDADSPIRSLLNSRQRAYMVGVLLLDPRFADLPAAAKHAHVFMDVGNNLDLIICGHWVCPPRRPVQVGKWLFIDTGAGYDHFDVPDAALSIVDPVGRRVIQARHDQYGTVSTSAFSLDKPIKLASAAVCGASMTMFEMSRLDLFSPLAEDEVTPSLLDIGPNPLGIDYFVGDIHGEGQLLARGLAEIGFDFAHDRLIAVGDLVNRGSDHTVLFNEVIPRIRHFCSVLGNHDIACIELLKDILDRGWASPYTEAEWLRNFPLRDQQRLVNFLSRLPLAISVTLRDGRRVGVIHADLPMDFSDFQSMYKVSKAEWMFCREGADLHTTLLGRGRMQSLNALLQSNVPSDPWLNPHAYRRRFEQPADMDLMICGHSYAPGLRPAQLGKWLFLDTGAGCSPDQLQGAALSIFEPLSRRVVQTFHRSNGDIGAAEYLLETGYQLPGTERSASDEN